MAELRRCVTITTAVAVIVAVAFLLAPPMGTDLSAQVARADFVREFGTTPIDLRWYGGTNQYGYSLVSPALMALFGTGPTGPRIVGALAAIGSAVLFALLVARTGAARPLLASIIGALCFFGNLVSGRVTYALGVAFGLAALLALTARPGESRYFGRLRLGLAAAGAVLASATSPVAGLFAGLAGVALFGAGRRRDGLVVAIAAAVPLAVTSVLSGEGGWMNISWTDAVRAIVASLAVAVLVPCRPVRFGALLSAAGVLVALAVHTPVGLNATRLATMFALPLIAGYGVIGWPRRSPAPGRAAPSGADRVVPSGAAGAAPVGRVALRAWGRLDPRSAAGWALAAVLVGVAVVSPPVVAGDLADAGNPTASPAYFAPLLARLAVEDPVGRIEIPPTRDYWESAYAARVVPLARGWLRQVDIARDPLFFDGGLSAERYHAWLLDNGVSFVAVPDAQLSWVGRGEAALIDAGQPYLTPVWQDTHWRLYRVTGTPSIVDAALVRSAGDRLVFDAGRAGDILVRIRWSDRLRASSASGSPVCVRASGRWTSVRVPAPGRYTVTSGLGPASDPAGGC